MEILVSFQLPANPSTYILGIPLASMGNLPIEAKGIPDKG